MPRLLAALVMVTLITSAVPTVAIGPFCHSCCDEPRYESGDGVVPPCCRLSPDAPRPVARKAESRDSGTPTVITALPAPVRLTAEADRHVRPAAVAGHHYLRSVILRI